MCDENHGESVQPTGNRPSLIAGLAENFDAVVIDGEAGIEQVNRRVIEHVTHLLTVSDLSARGINVVKSIRKVARSAVHYETTGLILNRVRREEELRDIIIPEELSLLGWVPEDEAVRNTDKGTLGRRSGRHAPHPSGLMVLVDMSVWIDVSATRSDPAAPRS